MDQQSYNLKENLKFRMIKVKKMAKKRKFVTVRPNSFEKTIIDEINKIILKEKKVCFNNKVQIASHLDKIVKKLRNYTIVRFDFKNYFNSLNLNYILEKCQINRLLNDFQQNFLKDYANFLKYCMPGINLNTTMAEVIASEFDREIKNTYKDIAFYERFVDDVIMIVNRRVPEDEIKARLTSTVNKIFYDESIGYKNKTQIHFDTKFNCFTDKDTPKSVNVLDFKISFADTITIGIADKEKIRFKKQIEDIILRYQDNDRALKTILKILARGVIYKKIRKNKTKWECKGFVSKYRLYSRYDCFKEDENFCKTVFIQAFIGLGLPVPFYLNEKCYDIIYNIKNKKYFVLDKISGVPRGKLVKIMANIGKKYDENTKYFDIASDLLKICQFN